MAITAADGSYTISNVAVGSVEISGITYDPPWHVREVSLSNWQQTCPLVPSGLEYYLVPPISGGDIPNINFGNMWSGDVIIHDSYHIYYDGPINLETTSFPAIDASIHNHYFDLITLTTEDPSPSPSVSPSQSPSISPSTSPSVSVSPSVSPSDSPSVSPSVSPSDSPSVSPSEPPVRWWQTSELDWTIGSIISGQIEDTYVAGGADLVLAEESEGPIGFEYNFIFGQDEFVPSSSLVANFIAYYTGTEYDVVKLQEWNYSTLTWTDVTSNDTDFPSASSEQTYQFELINNTDYLDNGQVQLRIAHSASGDHAHTFNINYMSLEYIAPPVPQYQFLRDVIARRGLKRTGEFTTRFIELYGGTCLEPTAFEPDAATYRGEYYYNAITNTLYKKIITRRQPGVVVAHWQKISL